ncbi:MAG: hypothetical protein ACLP01_05955 [Solirubrobacteraceae bacterium]
MIGFRAAASDLGPRVTYPVCESGGVNMLGGTIGLDGKHSCAGGGRRDRNATSRVVMAGYCLAEMQ